MKSNRKPETDHDAIHDAIDSILAGEEELIPSSGFMAATMERVREEAATPKPIPFPWLRALPGIVVIAAALCWLGFEAMRLGISRAGEASLAQAHFTLAAGRELEPVGWVAAALGVALLSWLLSRRFAGGSGLL